MKCPVCENELVEYNAGEVKIDMCSAGCAGMWFDKGEFEKIDEHTEPFPAELLELRRSPNVLIDRSKQRSCPRDGQEMERVVLDPETRLEIDSCTACGGQWLDAGELLHIRTEDEEEEQINKRIDAFNRKVEQQLSDVDKKFRVNSILSRLIQK